MFRMDALFFEADDPNGAGRVDAASYPLSVDLAAEGDFEMISGDDYMAQLFVVVNGHPYYSRIVSFTAGIPDGAMHAIEPAESPVLTGEAQDTGLWLRADRDSVEVADYITFRYGAEGGSNYRVVVDYASGGSYTVASKGGSTTHSLSFAQPGSFTAYVTADTPLGTLRSESVSFTVRAQASAPAAPSPGWEEPTEIAIFPTDEAAYQAKYSVGKRNACLVTKITKPAGSVASRCGLALYDENGLLLKDYWHDVTNVPADYTAFHAWYDLQSELGVALTPHTLYYYEFHAVIDGQTYTGARYELMTAGTLEERFKAVEPVTVNFDYNNSLGAASQRWVPSEGFTWGWFTTNGGWEPEYEGLPVPEDVHKRFVGWFTAREGGIQIKDGDPITVTTETNLYAHWAGADYTMTFDANGGSVSPATLPFTFGGTLSELPLPQREGYRFLGWYTAPTGGDKVGTGTTLNVEDYTLYAHWEQGRAAWTNPFTDVPAGSWYEEAVSRAAAEGLINGRSATSFAPSENLTMAEALKLAACLHQLLTVGQVTLQNSSSGPWYMSYYDYLSENGLLKSALLPYRDYSKKVTRGEMVRLFYDVTPYEYRKERQTIPIGSIPDVDEKNDDQIAYAYYVYCFYRAGILNGSDDYGTFYPEANIQRSAVASILIRIIDKEIRVGVPLKLGKG